LRNLKYEFIDASEGSAWRTNFQNNLPDGVSSLSALDDFKLPEGDKKRKGRVLSLAELKKAAPKTQANDMWPTLSLADLRATRDNLAKEIMGYLGKAEFQSKARNPYTNREVQTARGEYDRMMKRLQKLAEMKSNLMKFSDVSTIDNLMEKELDSYDKFFNRLFG